MTLTAQQVHDTYAAMGHGDECSLERAEAIATRINNCGGNVARASEHVYGPHSSVASGCGVYDWFSKCLADPDYAARTLETLAGDSSRRAQRCISEARSWVPWLANHPEKQKTIDSLMKVAAGLNERAERLRALAADFRAKVGVAA